LKWPSAHLLGYSGGSTTSFTALYPDLVQSLVVVAPAGLVRSATLTEKGTSYLKRGAGVDEGVATDWIVDFGSGGPLVVSPDWKASFAKGEISGEPIRVWGREHHKGHIPSLVAIFRDGGIFDMHQHFKKASQSGIRRLAVLGERQLPRKFWTLPGSLYQPAPLLMGFMIALGRFTLFPNISFQIQLM
jgi:pimeloyl-ACP methyl ester carboxylesterase